MPHSLRVRLKNLNRKGMLTDRELNRLNRALDDMENIEKDMLDLSKWYFDRGMEDYAQVIATDVINTIKKFTSRKEYVDMSVIEDIRREIAEYKDDKVIHAERNEMIDIVLDIIDKHTK